MSNFVLPEGFLGKVTVIEGVVYSGQVAKLLTSMMDTMVANNKLVDGYSCVLITSLSIVEILDILYPFRERYVGIDLIYYLDRVLISDGPVLYSLGYSGVTDIFIDGIYNLEYFANNLHSVGLFGRFCSGEGINLTYTKGVCLC